MIVGYRGLILALAVGAGAQTSTLPELGWAQTSVNVAVFRGNSLATFGQTQYVGYYNGEGKVVLAKRVLGSTTWTTKITSYSGTPSDAHNNISIMVDGSGFLHMAWNMHGTKLRYCKAIAAGSLEMGPETAMVGTLENSVTYPQFLRQADGNMLFLYRDGSSGNGNLVVDKYDIHSTKWTRVQSNLIDGQGARNAYWQATLDGNGVLHVSWVWRETSDVATNHDLGYARSRDGGVSWEKSTGEKYALPINAANAEYALKIPQNSELINQTSMYGDASSHPYIVSYWTPTGTKIPQYQMVYRDGQGWKTLQVSKRSTAFSLSGSGTKQIPISRPQVVVENRGDSVLAAVVFRDVERKGKVSVSWTADLSKNVWTTLDLMETDVASWEPSYDTDLWNTTKRLNLFVQKAGQGDGETTVNMTPQPVTVLEWSFPTRATSVTNQHVKRAIIHDVRNVAGQKMDGFQKSPGIHFSATAAPKISVP